MEKKNYAIKLSNKEEEEVQAFLYPGATINKTRQIGSNIKKRPGITRCANLSPNNAWNSIQYRRRS